MYHQVDKNCLVSKTRKLNDVPSLVVLLSVKRKLLSVFDRKWNQRGVYYDYYSFADLTPMYSSSNTAAYVIGECSMSNRGKKTIYRETLAYMRLNIFLHCCKLHWKIENNTTIVLFKGQKYVPLDSRNPLRISFSRLYCVLIKTKAVCVERGKLLNLQNNSNHLCSLPWDPLNEFLGHQIKLILHLQYFCHPPYAWK